jgi:hypothetical protein
MAVEAEAEVEDAAAAAPQKGHTAQAADHRCRRADRAAGGWSGTLLLRVRQAAPETHVAAVPESFIFNLPTMTVNLNNDGAETDQFMKLTVAIEVADEETMKEIQPRMAKVVDAFQVYLRELRKSDLEGSAGIYRLKEELGGASTLRSIPRDRFDPVQRNPGAVMADRANRTNSATTGTRAQIRAVGAAKPAAGPTGDPTEWGAMLDSDPSKAGADDDGGDKVLNQDEIDSLLGFDANATSGIELTGVQALINSALVSYERLPMLEIVFDRLVRLSTTSLRNFHLRQRRSLARSHHLGAVRRLPQLDPAAGDPRVFKAEEWDNFGLLTVKSV